MNEAALLGYFFTLVGFVVNFHQLRDSSRRATLDDFQNWLRAQQEDRLAQAIAESTALSQSIESLLGQTRDDVLSKLLTIENAVGALALRLQGMETIGHAVVSPDEISDQAMRLLTELNQTASGRVLYKRIGQVTICSFLPMGAGKFDADEPRFLLDDLDRLELLGWIKAAGSNNSGDPIFQITRAGASACTTLSAS